MTTRYTQAHTHDFQPLVQPFARDRAMGQVPSAQSMAQGVDALTLSINERLEALDTKVYGRISMTDLNGATRQVIHNKLSAEEYRDSQADLVKVLDVHESLITQNADQIALKVSTATYDAEKVIRSDTAPGRSEPGTLWLDTSLTPNMLKRWNGSGWEVVGTSRLSSSGITVEGDQVKIATPNFFLDLLNENGDPTISMHADDAGFDRLYADTIISPSVMTAGAEGSRIFTVGAGGNFATVADCFEALPHYIDGNVSIRLVSDLTENVVIRGGKWCRYLSLNLNGHTLFGTVSIICLGTAFAMTGGTIIDNRAEAESSGSTVTIERTSGVYLSDLVISGGGKADNGIYMYYSSGFISSCDICKLGTSHYAAACIKVSHACRVYIQGTKGTGKYGVSALYGAKALIRNGPMGNTANTYQSYAEITAFTDTFTQSDYEAAQQPEVPLTCTFTSTGGGSFRSDGFTETDGVFQGAYTPGKYKRGLWFFDYAAIQSALVGKTIKSVTFTCRRFASANGSASPQKPTFYYHNYAALPASMPTLSGTAATGVAWDRGDKKTITLPVSYGEALRDGKAKGIAIFAGSSTASPYMKFEPAGAVLTITCV